MLLAVAPIHAAAVETARVNVATYQSVSGAGQKAMEELCRYALTVSTSETLSRKSFDAPIAFNVIAGYRSVRRQRLHP